MRQPSRQTNELPRTSVPEKGGSWATERGRIGPSRVFEGKARRAPRGSHLNRHSLIRTRGEGNPDGCVAISAMPAPVHPQSGASEGAARPRGRMWGGKGRLSQSFTRRACTPIPR